MTATPWTQRHTEQPVPSGPDGEHSPDGPGRPDGAGRVVGSRHPGIGTREAVEQEGADMDRHDQVPADRHDQAPADRHNLGPADRHGTGTGTGIGTGIGTAAAPPIGTADRHDLGTGEWHHDGAGAGVDAATHHHIVMPDREGRTDVVRIGSADADEDRSARRRYPLVGGLRFWNEEIRLRDLLCIVREGEYNLAHIPVVRAANTAFFWSVTAPVVTIAFLLLWAFAISFHRAITITGVVLVAAQAVPVVPWLVVSTWPAAVWQWAGGAALVFGVGTAIAAAVERHR